MNEFKLEPTAGNVILRGVNPPEKKAGIIITVASAVIEYYEIISICEGYPHKPGTLVVLARFQGQQIIVDGEEYIVAPEESILAVVRS